MEWSYCIYDEEWIVDGIVCLGKELVAVYLGGVPIGLVMCCKLEGFTSINALTPFILIRTTAFNDSKRGMSLYCYVPGMLISHAESKRAIADHI